MPDNQPTDEALILDLYGGNETAFDQLYQRYYNHIGFYIKKHSVYKDSSFIDDVREILFIKIYTIIKEGKFEPRGPGSFKTFLYDTAQKTTFDENEKRMRSDRPVSEVFTDEELTAPDELCYREPDITDYDLINDRLEDVISELSLEEQKLIRLVSEGIPYKEIQRHPWFSKYSIDYLKHKVHNIRKRMRGK
jgi:RNA polymerase sigma factor (sigma-70 family)